MTLPDLASQFVYGRLAWAVVTATVLFALLSLLRAAPLPRRARAVLLAGMAVLFLLPGKASPAYWLTLAFQYPSGLLFGCCVLKLRQHWDGRAGGAPVMTPSLAGALALTGLLLYLDAMGLLTQGYYYAGFGPTAAPVLAVLGAIGCALALVQGQARAQAGALLTTILLFTLLRLPTGNLWDAVLDPLLWGWAVVTLAVNAVRNRARTRATTSPEPVAGQSAELQPVSSLSPLGPAAMEHSSTIKE
ncbi:hypothetical protein ACFFTM_07365 [Pseudoduganella plicata]|uniref:Uncharacterized protein n=1 Tax=Pseudoduganella plicata TaxID=321984 RepID=A0A4P7BHS8_9BURK|nr:hypothetical protein [Pseudoduganella plicata]QBQ38364.1 hypothetical protein E1742_20940 [Pseudoduganella plicata]GGY81539.1 hypothetical protein GCM10007388_12870 [Pseudoduganella plicata]